MAAKADCIIFIANDDSTTEVIEVMSTDTVATVYGASRISLEFALTYQGITLQRNDETPLADLGIGTESVLRKVRRAVKYQIVHIVVTNKIAGITYLKGVGVLIYPPTARITEQVILDQCIAPGDPYFQLSNQWTVTIMDYYDDQSDHFFDEGNPCYTKNLTFAESVDLNVHKRTKIWMRLRTHNASPHAYYEILSSIPHTMCIPSPRITIDLAQSPLRMGV